MKKITLFSMAICSLLVMAACGNDAQEATETPAEQTASQPVEQKAETEAEVPEVEVVAETEVEQSVEETKVLSDNDFNLLQDYSSKMKVITASIQPGLQALEQVVDYTNAGDLETVINQYNIAGEIFLSAEQEAQQLHVPELESKELEGLVNEWHQAVVATTSYGAEAMRLASEGFEESDQEKLSEADVVGMKFQESAAQIDVMIDKVTLFIDEAE